MAVPTKSHPALAQYLGRTLKQQALERDGFNLKLSRSGLSYAVVPLVLLLASAGMFLTAPSAGDFSWSDAPRHALNGAFILDMLRDRSWHHAAEWAMNYYIKYPSLSILFYPPFFYVIEAGFYAVLGVTHTAALAAETFFIFLLGAASYAFSRQFLPWAAALGVSLMTIGAPEIAYWDRQVMLDIPAYALTLSGMAFLSTYLRRKQPAALYLAAACLLAAVYTKYNVAFLLLPCAVAAIAAKGWRLILDRQVIVVSVIGCILSVPAIYMIDRFGSANVGSVAGRPGDLARDSLAAWLFYIDQIPHQLGYTTAGLALFALPLALTRRLRPVIDRWMWWLLTAWLIVGYVFFSSISVREPRHDLIILFPLILLAAFSVVTLLGPGLAGQAALLALGCATYGYSLFYASPPVVGGYRQVAEFVAEHAPPDSVILFSGYRDGNFVFDMREHPERKDLTLLRADKMLLRIAVERIRGVEQSDLDENGIKALLRTHGVAMVVAQDNFWQDLRQMARLTNVLRSSDFRRIQSLPITGDLEMNDGKGPDGAGRVDIYIPTYTVQKSADSIVIDLPIIRERITGRIGNEPSK